MPKAAKRICITVDDLPGASFPRSMESSSHSIMQVNTGIVDVFRQFGCPAVGFVTPQNQDFCGIPVVSGELLERIIDVWLVAGLEVGNHTLTHPHIHEIGVERYIEDVAAAAEILEPILHRYDQELTYFRHPYLRTGHNEAAKKSLAQYLQSHGCTVAPVTAYNEDWAFAQAFARAHEQNDQSQKEKITERYLSFTEDSLSFAEALSDKLFGRQIAHITVIHASFFTSLCLEELLNLLRGRGYSFISLADALLDEAYTSKDGYTGLEGPGWLERWSLGMNAKQVQPPQLPADILKIARQGLAL